MNDSTTRIEDRAGISLSSKLLSDCGWRPNFNDSLGKCELSSLAHSDASQFGHAEITSDGSINFPANTATVERSDDGSTLPGSVKAQVKLTLVQQKSIIQDLQQGKGWSAATKSALKTLMDNANKAGYDPAEVLESLVDGINELTGKQTLAVAVLHKDDNTSSPTLFLSLGKNQLQHEKNVSGLYNSSVNSLMLELGPLGRRT